MDIIGQMSGLRGRLLILLEKSPIKEERKSTKAADIVCVSLVSAST